MSLPSFICIGPGRAGTSWLYEVLSEHPEVCMAKCIKETQYFNENFDKGLEWYKTFFDGCREARARGEISNRYIFDPLVARRIKATISDCRILICMRNPYERIQSVYSFKLREGALDCSFEEALIKMPELIEENRYYSLLNPYYEIFGHENVFLLFFDEITAKPRELCKELFRFIGADDEFIPLVAEKKVNQAIIPRFPLAAHLTKGTAILMRRLELYGPLTWAKRSNILKALFFKEYDYKQERLMSPSAKSLLDPVILPELDKLEALIGKSLADWKS